MQKTSDLGAASHSNLILIYYDKNIHYKVKDVLLLTAEKPDCNNAIRLLEMVF